MENAIHLTPDAQRIFLNAQKSARQLEVETFEAEHLFVALIDDQETIATDILCKNFQLDAQQVKTLVELISRDHNRTSPASNGARPMANSVIQVLTVAAREMKHAGQAEIGVEHLLLGVTSSKDRVIQEILKRLNVKPQEVRLKIHERVPEISAHLSLRIRLQDRFREEFYHNFAYYVPQPIRKLFGRFLDSSQMPPLG